MNEVLTECPLKHSVVGFPACERQCQYSVRKNCEYQACQSAIAEPLRDKRMQKVIEIYGVSPEQVKTDSRNVMIALLLNAFFEHRNEGKPLIDCKKAELERLRASAQEFYTWRKGNTSPSFTDCLVVLDLIETNL